MKPFGGKTEYRYMQDNRQLEEFGKKLRTLRTIQEQTENKDDDEVIIGEK